MNMRKGLGLAAALGVIVVASQQSADSQTDSQTNSPGKTNVQLLMREKLDHAQAVLEGVVTGDYDQIAESAEWMRMASQAASWQAIDTEEYRRHSDNFRQMAERLRDQANEQNLDASTLQHVKLTLGCIDCHRYIRAYHAAQDAAD